ncbi:capsular biosynthesis protein [Clostridium sp. NSJ-49]|uniref:YveK family protein n=1 Tax=Clostridium TaxID=1485 RepID=UPI00164AE617|nr:Wzz/FepE/Etk N-terminal domain-containing protein [Clostridium sp. NSJ-49]MBC5624095.1 capsular biosynthesis protein [Clostridium sp. NSJ-49]
MTGLRVENIIKVLKDNIRLIIISTLTVTLVAAIITFFFISPQYEATTKVFIGKENFKNVSSDYTNEEITLYQRLLKTYSEIFKTKNLMSKAISNVGEDVTVEEAMSKSSAVPISDTQILKLKYVSDSKEESYNMTYGLTEEFMKLSKTLYPNGNVYIIQQPIIPVNPIGPNKVMNILIGLILGLAIGVGIALFKEFMNNSFNSKDEIEESLDIPCLGMIPNIK